MKMTFLGDVHGKFDKLPNILKKCKTPKVYCVGDYGWGFNEPLTEDDLPVDEILSIRGNHDSPYLAKRHPHYLGDYGITEEGIFFMSGAWSIDRVHRTPEVSWWHDEELSIEDMMNAGALFIDNQPKVVMTHDCPLSIARIMVELIIAHNPQSEEWGRHPETRTSKYLEEMWNAVKVKPKIWIFGHWHVPFDEVIRGTRFICVPTLTLKEINLPS